MAPFTILKGPLSQRANYPPKESLNPKPLISAVQDDCELAVAFGHLGRAVVLASLHLGPLGGSWVVINGVISRVTIHIRALITPLITTHEPPSRAFPESPNTPYR